MVTDLIIVAWINCDIYRLQAGISPLKELIDHVFLCRTGNHAVKAADGLSNLGKLQLDQ